MPSFESINYNIRPSKSVQRSLVFNGLNMISREFSLKKAIYVGFGSVWFTDFVQAHKLLNIDDMVSIERDEIGYMRAMFNKPYKSIKVLEGEAADKLPEILSIKKDFNARPWIIWLDYDAPLNEDIVNDMVWILSYVPPDSVILFTFSGHASKENYGKQADRPLRLKSLLGGVVPNDLSVDDCNKERLPFTLLKYVMDFIKSKAAKEARGNGKFIEAFRIPYRDTSPMVTVGGVLSSNQDNARKVQKLVNLITWEGLIDETINIPPLTLRELISLQSILPSKTELTRKKIKRIGFDLREEQIRLFQKYYKYYPNFAQVLF